MRRLLTSLTQFLGASTTVAGRWPEGRALASLAYPTTDNAQLKDPMAPGSKEASATRIVTRPSDPLSFRAGRAHTPPPRQREQRRWEQSRRWIHSTPILRIGDSADTAPRWPRRSIPKQYRWRLHRVLRQGSPASLPNGG